MTRIARGDFTDDAGDGFLHAFVQRIVVRGQPAMRRMDHVIRFAFDPFEPDADPIRVVASKHFQLGQWRGELQPNQQTLPIAIAHPRQQFQHVLPRRIAAMIEKIPVS